MQAVLVPTVVDRAVAGLDAWLETMRGPTGYGGPVAHWWQQRLCYTAPGRDWRYEGIMCGYLALWRRCGEPRWLERARRAGDDLLAGQIAGGHFAGSGFELNPSAAGTPHEAACAVALLNLARELRTAGDPAWERYLGAAQRTIQEYYLEQLWDAKARALRDLPGQPSFVPNKAATACEALLLLSELSGEARWAEEYALPTLDRVLEHQLRGGPFDGAIIQNSFGTRRIQKFFPVYIARCVPALLQGHAISSDERYLDGAVRAMSFVARICAADAPPTVVYPGGRSISRPAWVAALGDILRAARLLEAHGLPFRLEALEARLLAGQDASGGIQTATGFAGQAGGRLGELPDLRDLLHVVGWCDKAFRYLAERAGPGLPAVEAGSFESPCVYHGRRLVFRETPEAITVREGRTLRYHWRKGADWPDLAAPIFWT